MTDQIEQEQFVNDLTNSERMNTGEVQNLQG